MDRVLVVILLALTIIQTITANASLFEGNNSMILVGLKTKVFVCAQTVMQSLMPMLGKIPATILSAEQYTFASGAQVEIQFLKWVKMGNFFIATMMQIVEKFQVHEN
ncbi:uncharacterized protein LOC132757018 [Ruditapes philippinarum]|uniref:uncharacterized protein LOC132757018 n=1 Tax=Ruditapes philippinarum TaxID=129788 RepID=UPI00295A5969|nr:uncharacterized protein LOC132757018 [Ruditapes philippinarum]